MTATHQCGCGRPIFGESECSACRVDAYLARKKHLRMGEAIQDLEQARERVRRAKAAYQLHRDTSKRRFCMSVGDDGRPCPDFAMDAGLCPKHRGAQCG